MGKGGMWGGRRQASIQEHKPPISLNFAAMGQAVNFRDA